MVQWAVVGDNSVFLLRHGQSTWNLERRLQGWTSHPPLTDLGVQQMRSAAIRLQSMLNGQQIAVVYTSDLRRARQSAQIVAAELGCAVVADPRLREQGNGSLEGKLGYQLTEEPTPPGVDISEVRWGNGESVRDVYQRLAEFFATLPPGPQVIVSHGITICVARALLTGGDHRQVDWDEMPNAAICVLERPTRALSLSVVGGTLEGSPDRKDTDMKLQGALETAFNEQVTMEVQASVVYRQLGVDMDVLNLPGIASWFRLQAEEEVTHADKFINHMTDRDSHPRIGALAGPAGTVGTVLDAFKAALAHEEKVSEAIRTLYRLASAEGDIDALPLLNWFVEEQIEEEATVAGIIGRLELIGDDGYGLLQLDAELGARQAEAAG